MKKQLASLTLATLFIAPSVAAEIKVGYIGPMRSDDGMSAMRGAEMAIDELNTQGGVLGQEIVLVTAESGFDVDQGKAAYDRLVLEDKVDLIISGTIDDVSVAFMPSVREYQIPTIDTWTTSVSIIDMLVEDYDSMRSYFMNAPADEALVTQYIGFGADVLAGKLGFKGLFILADQTSFGEAITGLIAEAFGPNAEIEVLGTRSFDINTSDFEPYFDEAVASGADFIYLISTVHGEVVASQYAKLQMPMSMTGVLGAAISVDFWADTGGLGGGASTFSPAPTLGFALDDGSQAFVDRYLARYDTRPTIPTFAGFHAYYGVKQAMTAAETAGGFALDTWVPEMEQQDLVLEVDGEVALRYAYWGNDEVDPVTGRTYPHNLRFDIGEQTTAGPAMVVLQWYEDGTPPVVYPEKYKTGEFILPTWITE